MGHCRLELQVSSVTLSRSLQCLGFLDSSVLLSRPTDRHVATQFLLWWPAMANHDRESSTRRIRLTCLLVCPCSSGLLFTCYVRCIDVTSARTMQPYRRTKCTLENARVCQTRCPDRTTFMQNYRLVMQTYSWMDTFLAVSAPSVTCEILKPGRFVSSCLEGRMLRYMLSMHDEHPSGRSLQALM
jgi:hypothetical protein